MATLLQADNLVKRYGFQEVLSGASFAVAEKQKIGVIGRNGAGKSTLLRILTGDEVQDSGGVQHHTNLRLGYLKQHEELNLNEPALTYLTRSSGKPEWSCAKLAARFGLTPELLAKPVGELSSGFRMRLKLTAMLSLEPNLILLDEPTNFLDLTTQLLLEDFLRDWNGAYLIVSHDRELLKNTCNETLEVERGKCFLYRGNIESYLAWKDEQLAFAENENEKTEAQRKHLQSFVDRFRFKASKATQAQSKLKQIARLTKIEITHPMKGVRITIPVDKIKKGIAVRLDELVVGYGAKRVAGPATFDIDRGKHAAIVGDNGQGKTTLLRTLSGHLAAFSGAYAWGAGLKVAYYGQSTLEAMSPKDSVKAYLSRFAGADVTDEQVLRMAGNFLFRDDDLLKSVNVLSGGERARLCLAGLLLSKASVFLLDEPTNHLDFETVEALAVALREYPGTILFVSHNRTFVNLVATVIVEVKDGTIRRYNGTYEEYVHDLATRLESENVSSRSRKAESGIMADVIPDQVRDDNEIKDQLEAERKKLRQNERARTKLEEERDGILTEMGITPANYSKQLTIRLHAVTTEILKLEDEWLLVQRNIEWLNRE